MGCSGIFLRLKNWLIGIVQLNDTHPMAIPWDISKSKGSAFIPQPNKHGKQKETGQYQEGAAQGLSSKQMAGKYISAKVQL